MPVTGCTKINFRSRDRTLILKAALQDDVFESVSIFTREPLGVPQGSASPSSKEIRNGMREGHTSMIDDASALPLAHSCAMH